MVGHRLRHWHLAFAEPYTALDLLAFSLSFFTFYSQSCQLSIHHIVCKVHVIKSWSLHLGYRLPVSHSVSWSLVSSQSLLSTAVSGTRVLWAWHSFKVQNFRPRAWLSDCHWRLTHNTKFRKKGTSWNTHSSLRQGATLAAFKSTSSNV